MFIKPIKLIICLIEVASLSHVKGHVHFFSVIGEATIMYLALYVILPVYIIVTTIGEACVCVCAKFDQFLPVRPHFDTKRPVNFFHIATFPSPTFGPLFAFHCPLFFTKNNDLHAAMF